ncbi:MAG TPA: mobile mystery protein A [Rhodothermales bacterium]|nr:mobile mystery protein A [Rhodothermales bacterium]
MPRLDDLKRRQVEESISRLDPLRGFERPKGGWIKTIRGALGMTMKQLGRRVGVSQPMVSQYERAETEDSITLGTLRKVADSLGCDLVYGLVPRTPIQTTIRNQARRAAERRIRRVHESMAMEDQSVTREELERQINDYASDLVERRVGSMWED